MATVYAEARGEINQGIEWVAWVIKNRVVRRGSSIREVCLAPWQFECWNGREAIDINEHDAFNNCRHIVQQVVNSGYDPTNGCDHYNNTSIEDFMDKRPGYRLVRRERVGNHQFYKSY